jgi:protein CpxP
MENRNRSTRSSVRLMASSALVAILAFAQAPVFASDKDAHEDRTELRIKDMHAKLKITAAQEGLWGKIAKAMLEDAKTMDALTQARVDQAKTMTAVEDLKSYGEVAQAHADGIKKLAPAFADLYASMSDTQKKEADTLFREGAHPHKHKHGHKKHGDK